MVQTEIAALQARFGERYRQLLIVTLVLGVCAAVMEATLVNLALPHIMASFGLGQDKVQLLSTAFLAAGTVSMLSTAWFAGRFGFYRSYLAALALFTASSLVGALTPDGWFAGLLLARIGQGAAAGLIQPLAMMKIFHVFPREARGKALAAYGLGIVLSPAIGPVLSGIAVDWLGWRAVFVLTVPLCAISAAMARHYIARTAEDPQRPLDSGGLALLTMALLGGLSGLSQLHDGGLRAYLPLALGAGATLAFIAWQQHSRAPLLPLALFGHRSFRAAALVSVAYGMGLYGSTYLVPLSLQTIAHYSGSATGLLLLPSGLALGVALQLGGRLTDSGWAQRGTFIGLALFALASFLLGWSIAAPAAAVMIAWTSLSRLGLGLIVPGLNQSAVDGLPPALLNHATAAINFLRQLGGALGVSLTAQFLAWRHATEAPAGAFADSYAMIGWVFVASLLPCVSMLHCAPAGPAAAPRQARA